MESGKFKLSCKLKEMIFRIIFIVHPLDDTLWRGVGCPPPPLPHDKVEYCSFLFMFVYAAFPAQS